MFKDLNQKNMIAPTYEFEGFCDVEDGREEKQAAGVACLSLFKDLY